MENTTITKIVETDYESLVDLFQEMAEFQGVPEKMKNSLEQMENEKECINGFVAKNDEGKIIGYAVCFFAYFTWIGKSLYMDDLYVRDEYRGQGIGSNLVDAVITYAKEEKCNKLRWQVGKWNKGAIKFYEKLGVEVNKDEMNCDLIF